MIRSRNCMSTRGGAWRPCLSRHAPFMNLYPFGHATNGSPLGEGRAIGLLKSSQILIFDSERACTEDCFLVEGVEDFLLVEGVEDRFLVEGVEDRFPVEGVDCVILVFFFYLHIIK